MWSLAGQPYAQKGRTFDAKEAGRWTLEELVQLHLV